MGDRMRDGGPSPWGHVTLYGVTFKRLEDAWYDERPWWLNEIPIIAWDTSSVAFIIEFT